MPNDDGNDTVRSVDDHMVDQVKPKITVHDYTSLKNQYGDHDNLGGGTDREYATAPVLLARVDEDRLIAGLIERYREIIVCVGRPNGYHAEMARTTNPDSGDCLDVLPNTSLSQGRYDEVNGLQMNSPVLSDSELIDVSRAIEEKCGANIQFFERQNGIGLTPAQYLEYLKAGGEPSFRREDLDRPRPEFGNNAVKFGSDNHEDFKFGADNKPFGTGWESLDPREGEGIVDHFLGDPDFTFGEGDDNPANEFAKDDSPVFADILRNWVNSFENDPENSPEPAILPEQKKATSRFKRILESFRRRSEDEQEKIEEKGEMGGGCDECGHNHKPGPCPKSIGGPMVIPEEPDVSGMPLEEGSDEEIFNEEDTKKESSAIMTPVWVDDESNVAGTGKAAPNMIGGSPPSDYEQWDAGTILLEMNQMYSMLILPDQGQVWIGMSPEIHHAQISRALESNDLGNAKKFEAFTYGDRVLCYKDASEELDSYAVAVCDALALPPIPYISTLEEFRGDVSFSDPDSDEGDFRFSTRRDAPSAPISVEAVGPGSTLIHCQKNGYDHGTGNYPVTIRVNKKTVDPERPGGDQENQWIKAWVGPFNGFHMDITEQVPELQNSSYNQPDGSRTQGLSWRWDKDNGFVGAGKSNSLINQYQRDGYYLSDSELIDLSNKIAEVVGDDDETFRFSAKKINVIFGTTGAPKGYRGTLRPVIYNPPNAYVGLPGTIHQDLREEFGDDDPFDGESYGYCVPENREPVSDGEYDDVPVPVDWQMRGEKGFVNSFPPGEYVEWITNPDDEVEVTRAIEKALGNDEPDFKFGAAAKPITVEWVGGHQGNHGDMNAGDRDASGPSRPVIIVELPDRVDAFVGEVDGYHYRMIQKDKNLESLFYPQAALPSGEQLYPKPTVDDPVGDFFGPTENDKQLAQNYLMGGDVSDDRKIAAGRIVVTAYDGEQWLMGYDGGIHSSVIDSAIGEIIASGVSRGVYEPDEEDFHFGSERVAPFDWSEDENFRTASDDTDYLDSREAKQWLPHPDETDEYMRGQCAAWADAHQEEYPHLRFGVDWERMTPDHPSYKDYKEDMGEDPEDGEWWRPQHYFTHDDNHWYDVEGAHPLSELPQWDRHTLNEDNVWFHGDLESGCKPDPEWVRRYAPVPKQSSSEALGRSVTQIVANNPVIQPVVDALMAAGGQVYAVGGAVRDTIMGKTPKDIDLMVTGIPKESMDSVLEPLGGSIDYTGKDFGVFRYKEAGEEVEIALPRHERSTGNKHTDFSVDADHTMTPEEDLFRRDFTANAMAVNLGTGELIDPYDGEEDIRNGQLKTIHDQSLNEDPLRVARALVAKGRHGLHPDEGTIAQMAEAAENLQHLPAERVQAELDKIFGSDDPVGAIRLAHESGALKYILPEVDATFGYDQNNPHHDLELGEHMLDVLDRVSQKTTDPDARLAGLLHDIGKPASAWVNPERGTNHYYQKKFPDGSTIGQQHELVGEEMARDAMTRLRYPKDRTDRVSEMIKHHMFAPFDSEKGARKFLNRVEPHADDLLNLRWADQASKGKDQDAFDANEYQVQRNLVDQVRQQQQPTNLSQLAINGQDLVEAGIPQGPMVGEILQNLMTQVIGDPSMNDRDKLLQLARGSV